MTAKKDLKRLVRERMGKTGERYTEALERVRRPSLIETMPPARDLSAIAKREGFDCSAQVLERTWKAIAESEVSPEAWFEEVFAVLRRQLVAARGMAGPDQMRAVLVYREPIKNWPTSLMFLREVDGGRRGISPDGNFAAFEIPRANGTTSLVTMWILAHRPRLEPLMYFAIDADLSWVNPDRWAEALAFVQRLGRR